MKSILEKICSALNINLPGTGAAPGGKTRSFTFPSLPTNTEELRALPGFAFTDIYSVPAATVAALTLYESNPEACIGMLDFLMGPADMSGLDKERLRDRLQGKQYKVMSFFDGAVPSNDYTPSQPYTVKVSSNPYSFPEEGWATLYLTSGGSDSPRPVKLRQKKSTGEWFLNDILFLSDIRLPASQDAWS